MVTYLSVYTVYTHGHRTGHGEGTRKSVLGCDSSLIDRPLGFVTSRNITRLVNPQSVTIGTTTSPCSFQRCKLVPRKGAKEPAQHRGCLRCRRPPPTRWMCSTDLILDCSISFSAERRGTLFLVLLLVTSKPGFMKGLTEALIVDAAWPCFRVSRF